MDIFIFAMEKEKNAELCYRQLADKTDVTGMKNICTMLADEEVKHYNLIARLKENQPVEIDVTSLLVDAKDIFAKMQQATESFEFDRSQVQLYKKARQIEADSRDFYLEKAAGADSDELKKILLTLAEEEKKHYHLLDNIVEFVARPDAWLENAEFYHLEDY